MERYTVIVKYPDATFYVAHVAAESLLKASLLGKQECADKADVPIDELETEFILSGHQDLEYRRDFDGELEE
jgi:hypothetical protein